MIFMRSCWSKVTDDNGNVIERARTTVNHAMKTCRRAWNVVGRRNPGKLPLINPFAQMGLRSSDRETPTATFEELRTFRNKAAELGLQSLATAALIGWEWLQRGEDIFATFKVEHYRPKERSQHGQGDRREDQRRKAGFRCSTRLARPLSRINGRAGRDQARTYRRADAVPGLGRTRSVADMAKAG